MGVSQRKSRYLREHYRRHSDGQLAKALGVDKAVVRKTRERLGLERTKADDTWLRDHADEPLPAYTGQAPRPEARPLRRWDYVVAGVAALAALAVYVRTLGPTVTGEDSGELITAAYTLGVAHPPGYPLWTMLGKLFTFIPHGTVAWRVNFMSAWFGACTVFVTCLFITKLTHNRLAALAGALAFAFSGQFWAQAVIAEVYTLNMFLLGLCLLALLVWYETRHNRMLCALAFCYGLGLANHNTTMLLGPVFVGFILIVDREFWTRWKTYAACTALSLATAFALYLYLPLASMHNPPVDWGNPETLENFLDHVTRKQYSFAFTENPRSLGRFAQQVWAFLGFYAGEFTPWLAAVPLLGAWALWRRDRYRLGLVLGLFAMTVLGFILATNFKLDKESLWVNSVFFVPAYYAAAMLLAGAVDAVAGLRLKGRRLLVPAAVLGAAAVVLPLAAHYRTNDKSDYYFAYDYGRNVLRTLAKDAIYLPTADHATFPLLYLQAVEGRRTDVTVGNKYGYPEETLYRDMPEAQRAGFRKIPTDAEEKIIEDWVIANTTRPVYYTKKRGLASGHMADAGLLYRVVREGEEWKSPDLWPTYKWHTLKNGDTRGDYTAQLVLADYWFARGRCLLAGGKADEGLKAFDESLRAGGENRENLNNIGSACAEAGQLDAALKRYARALELDPEYELSLKNLGKVYLQQQRPDYALGLFDRVLKQGPADYEGLFHGAQCLAQLGRPVEAFQRYQRLSQFYPDDPAAYREMGYLLQATGDLQGAQQFYTQSLSLDRNQPQLALQLSQLHSNATSNPQQPGLPQIPSLPEMPSLDPQSLMPPMPNPGPTMPQLPNLPSAAPPPAGPGAPPAQ